MILLLSQFSPPLPWPTSTSSSFPRLSSFSCSRIPIANQLDSLTFFMSEFISVCCNVFVFGRTGGNRAKSSRGIGAVPQVIS